MEDILKKNYKEYFNNPEWIYKRILEQREYMTAYLKKVGRCNRKNIRPDWNNVMESARDRYNYFVRIFNASK